MVFYFKARSEVGDYVIYMGLDKHENEDLIKYGLPEDIWFHVDKLSSAHVYLRMHKGQTMEMITPELLEDCAQLVKANSIQGNKLNNLDVVYTPWFNLRKTPSMDMVRVETRKNQIVNRLNKTITEQTPDLKVSSIMEELHCSPTVHRQLCPSPLRGTHSPSKEHLRTLYVSPVPGFMLDKQDHAVELPSHYLPDFCFRLVDGHSNPTDEQLDELALHFPGCTGISYGHSFLVVSWSELPIKQWPLTVGGVPLYYATPEHRLPPTFGRAGGSVPIMEDCPLPLWEEPSTVLMDQIMEFLVGRGIGVRFFGWCGVRWYAEVESHADGMMLPCKICGLLAVWKVFPMHEESGRRVIPLGGDVIDSTSYRTELRPGVLVASAGGLGSTSGIPIMSPQGEHYVTVAAHSFPGDDIKVYHPACSEANLIGKVDLILPNSDIALVKLAGGLTYSSTSFDGEELNGTKLLGLLPSKKVDLMARVYLDSPYNGKCQGIVTFKGRSVLFPSTTTIECNMV